MPEYWIVSSDARTIARWRSLEQPAELLTERAEWRASPEMEPFVLGLAEFFEDALG